MTTRFVTADPYPWPYDGDLRAGNTALIVIDMQTDFCGMGGYVDRWATTSRSRARRSSRSGPCSRRCARRGLSRDPHARGPSARPVGSARQQALALAAHRRRHRRPRARAGASSCAASRAGRSSPSWRPRPGEVVIDKPGKGSFCATDLELILRTRGITQPRAHRHHHRRVRAHDHARGQRSRLRVPAARGLHRRDRPAATTTPRSRWSRCRAACSARWRARPTLIDAAGQGRLMRVPAARRPARHRRRGRSA